MAEAEAAAHSHVKDAHGVHWISPQTTVTRGGHGNAMTGYLLKQVRSAVTGLGLGAHRSHIQRLGGTNLIRRWHPRWFRLQGSVLSWQHYANSHMKRSRVRRRQRQRPSIDLADPKVSLVIEAKLFKAPTPFTFQVVSTDIVLNLCAHDEGDFFQWIEAIAAVIHNRDESLSDAGDDARSFPGSVGDRGTSEEPTDAPGRGRAAEAHADPPGPAAASNPASGRRGAVLARDPSVDDAHTASSGSVGPSVDGRGASTASDHSAADGAAAAKHPSPPRAVESVQDADARASERSGGVRRRRAAASTPVHHVAASSTASSAPPAPTVVPSPGKPPRTPMGRATRTKATRGPVPLAAPTASPAAPPTAARGGAGPPPSPGGGALAWASAPRGAVVALLVCNVVLAVAHTLGRDAFLLLLLGANAGLCFLLRDPLGEFLAHRPAPGPGAAAPPAAESRFAPSSMRRLGARKKGKARGEKAATGLGASSAAAAPRPGRQPAPAEARDSAAAIDAGSTASLSSGDDSGDGEDDYEDASPATAVAAAAVEAARASRAGAGRPSPLRVGRDASPAAAPAAGAMASAGLVSAGEDDDDEEEEVEEKLDWGQTIPFAAADADDLVHACVAVDATEFRVREGPNYPRNKRKAPSAPAFYDFRGCDVFHSAGKIDHIARLLNLPFPDGMGPGTAAAAAVEAAGLPLTLVVNWQLPDYTPPTPLWGGTQEDGPGWSVVGVFTIKPEVVAMLARPVDEWPPALRIWQRFVAEPVGGAFHDRFKACVRGLNLGAIGAGALERYNGKPVLTRPQHRMWQGPGYYEVDIDVHLFNYIARRVFSSFRHKITDMLFINAAYVVEARDEDEMPEGVIAAHGLRRVDWSRAVEIDLAGDEEDEEEEGL